MQRSTSGRSIFFTVAGAIAQQRIETIVTLCDNETELVIAGLKPGQALERGAAFQVADKFMGEWKKKNPGSNWIMAMNMAPGPPVAM